MTATPGDADRDATVQPLLPASRRGWLQPVARAITAIECVLGSLLLAGMTSLLIIQVFGRNVLSSSFFWADEVARLSLIWMTMVGVAYAVGKGSHLTVTAVTDYLPPTVRVWFQRAALLLICGTGVLLTPAAAELMVSIGGVAASSSGIPRSVFFLASVIGFGLAAIQALIVLLVGPQNNAPGHALVTSLEQGMKKPEDDE